MKMYYDTNQLPELLFFGPHKKPHGTRWLNKNYHLSFYPKLGHRICAIIRISCACVECTSIMDKSWISGIMPKKQVC